MNEHAPFVDHVLWGPSSSMPGRVQLSDQNGGR